MCLYSFCCTVKWISYVLCLLPQSCPALCSLEDCSSPGSSVYRDSPGKNTGVGCLSRGSPPGDLPNPSIEPRSPALQADSLPAELPRKPEAAICIHICCTQYASKFGKLSSGHRAGKGQFSLQSLRKEIPKNAQTTTQLHSSHTLVIFQAKLQQYMNWELPDIQSGFRKGRGTRDQIANICWIIEKAREFQKNIYFYFIDYAKAFDCVDHNKLENSERDGNTRPPDLPLEKPVCRWGSNS